MKKGNETMAIESTSNSDRVVMMVLKPIALGTRKTQVLSNAWWDLKIIYKS